MARLQTIGTGTVLLMIGLAQILTGSAQVQAKAETAKACIAIQQMSPVGVKVDDSGNTTEPIRFTLIAQGTLAELKGAQVIYMEDGAQKSATSVGDLRTGSQTVTILPGLHMNTSSETFDITLIGPDGSETPDMTEYLWSPNAVPPPKAPKTPTAPGDQEQLAEAVSDQPIATIEPGVDREEAESITGFNANQVGIVSDDIFVKSTSGDESNRPPQTITLRGVNFKDGMLVRFSTMKGGKRVEATSPLTHTRTIATLVKPTSWVPNNPSAFMSAVVVVPVQITHIVSSQFSVRAAHAQISESCK